MKLDFAKAWHRALAGVSRLGSALRRTGHFTLLRFRKAECFRSAAAISYFALLSFLPFLIMLLSALGFVLFFLGQEYGSQEAYIDALLKTTGEVIPFLQENLAQRLRELIEAREAMGIVAVVALIFTSSLVFSSLEEGLERIFEVGNGRHILVSKLLFLAFVGTVGVVTVITHYAIVFADSFIAAAGGKPLIEYVYSTPLASKLFTWAGSVIAFVILVRYFCPRRISLPLQVAGATVFFGLFELAKWIFSLYLEYVAEFSALYGSLSTFMVLVVWTFYTVAIFLLSACIVQAVDRHGFWPPKAE